MTVWQMFVFGGLGGVIFAVLTTIEKTLREILDVVREIAAKEP